MKNEDIHWLDVVRDALDTPPPAHGPTSPDERLWAAIESRLDARARRTVLWRRTAMGIAAAAVLGLLTLATLTKQDNAEFRTPQVAGNAAAVNPDTCAPASAEAPPTEYPVTLYSANEANVAAELAPEKEPSYPPAAENGSSSSSAAAESDLPDNASEAGPPAGQKDATRRNDRRQLREALFLDREKHRRSVAFKAGIGGAGMASASSTLYRNGNMASSPGDIFADGSAPQTITYDHDMPVTAELSAGVAIGRRLYVGTGINYTWLNSRITKRNGAKAKTVRQRIDLIGIPIEVNYAIIAGNRLTLYAGTGIMAQRCLSARHDRMSIPAPGLLWSAEADLGVQYAFGRTVGIYAEPSISHHFTRNGLRTIYTDREVNFSLKFGLRFTFSGM